MQLGDDVCADRCCELQEMSGYLKCQVRPDVCGLWSVATSHHNGNPADSSLYVNKSSGIIMSCSILLLNVKYRRYSGI